MPQLSYYFINFLNGLFVMPLNSIIVDVEVPSCIGERESSEFLVQHEDICHHPQKTDSDHPSGLGPQFSLSLLMLLSIQFV